MTHTHQRLMKKLRELTIQYMEIGGLLRDIRDYEVFKEEGCSSFKEYLEQYADISYETSYRWMKIHQVFSPLRFPEGLILGSTKMYLLSSLVNQDNVVEMLRWAQVASSAEIRMALKSQRNRTLSLWLTEEEYERAREYISDSVKAGAPTQGSAAMFLLDMGMNTLAA